LDCLPLEGEAWVVPPKDFSRPEWRDREDLRDMIICSIDPPSKISLKYLCKLIYILTLLKTVRILMMLYTPVNYQMVTSRPEFVSPVFPFLSLRKRELIVL
jgi:hypothetical protein